MSTPIFQVFIGKNNIASNLAIRGLSDEAQKDMMEKNKASVQSVGGSIVVLCNSAWADEEHPWWGVIRFPSLEARIEHARDLKEIGWLDHVDAFTLLGTAEAEPPAVTIPNPIYKLWILRTNPAASMASGSLPGGVMTLGWSKHYELYHEHNSLILLQCNSYWCNEAYPNFGVSVYPSIEANMRIMQGLADLGWQRYFDSFTILGTSDQ